jgi:hypothetical protein
VPAAGVILLFQEQLPVASAIPLTKFTPVRRITPGCSGNAHDQLAFELSSINNLRRLFFCQDFARGGSAAVQAEPFTSAIGHAATAAVLSEQLGIDVPLNRIQIAMDVADKAIVFRLRDRLPENAVLSKAELLTLPSEFGLLTRVE